jgi:hypothetical protein
LGLRRQNLPLFFDMTDQLPQDAEPNFIHPWEEEQKKLRRDLLWSAKARALAQGVQLVQV